MEVVRLSLSDASLLAARYAEHNNSHRRMTQALREAGAAPMLERLGALRQLERRFDVDLGLLCHWFERRNHADVHPVERALTAYLTSVHDAPQHAEVWILVDRLRELRDLLEESRLVGEPEP
jgi:hypothetical protein